jgi:ABC transport system ATP-binding/permease protein
VLVTHDRYLLDRVSTAVLGLDGQGSAVMYADYWQWEQAQFAPKPKVEKTAAPKPVSVKRKLSYLEAREWEQMEARIMDAEQELETIRAEMQSPEVVSDGVRLHACYQKMQDAEGRVAALYERWAELEAKQ